MQERVIEGEADRTEIMESLAEDAGDMTRNQALIEINKRGLAPIASPAEDELTIEAVLIQDVSAGKHVDTLTKRVYATCEECESSTVHRVHWWENPKHNRREKCLTCGVETKITNY